MAIIVFCLLVLYGAMASATLGIGIVCSHTLPGPRMVNLQEKDRSALKGGASAIDSCLEPKSYFTVTCMVFQMPFVVCT